MHSNTLVGTWCAAALVTAWAPAAHAAIVEGTLQFETWGFKAVHADGYPVDSVAPVSPVIGFVHYRFDNSASFMFQANGALVNGVALEVSAWGLNIPWSGVLSVSYLKAPPNLANAYDTLAFSQGPTTAVDYGVDDWRLMVSNISTRPTFMQFWYSPQGEQIAYGQASMVRAVPEPAAAGLLLAGLAGLATGMRRRGQRLAQRSSARVS